MTIQVQAAGACTTSVCVPMLDCVVTDCPDGPVSLMAGVPVGADPAGPTNTWNDGPAAGAGEHLKAQPIFHEAAVVVNAVLVQLPCCCGERRRTRAGPAAAVDDVDVVVDVVVEPPAAEVVVDSPPAVDFVDPPAAVVVVAELPPGAVVVVAVLPAADEPDDDEFSGGRVPEVVLLVLGAPPPVSPLIHIPKTAASKNGGQELPGLPGSSLLELELAWLGRAVRGRQWRATVAHCRCHRPRLEDKQPIGSGRDPV